MLIIDDTPGVKAIQADVMPGEKVGTSDFAIAADATAPYNGYVMLDNYGSVYTGKDRLSSNADWNSPGGRGDQLSLGGLATQDSGLLNGRLAYSALAATNGTHAEEHGRQRAHERVGRWRRGGLSIGQLEPGQCRAGAGGTVACAHAGAPPQRRRALQQACAPHTRADPGRLGVLKCAELSKAVHGS